MVKRRRLTEREWEAIEAALGFVLAGEDPWESEAPEGEESETLKACRSAYQKL